MARVTEHLKAAGEFAEVGVREYAKGRRLNDLTRIRGGCEKVFHVYTEAVAALIQKRGLPEPESHKDRWDALSKLGRRSRTG